MSVDLAAFERLLRPQGPSALADIASALATSTKTVQRLVAAAGDAVVAAGQTRRRRVAWRRPLRGVLAALPLYRIDAEGRPQPVGQLRPVWPQGCHLALDADAAAWPQADATRDGWHDGLPYPLYDLRPQGFLGRAFAREHAERLALPADPRAWGDDDILLALADWGVDLPGNLLLGDAALRRALDARLQPPAPLEGDALAAAYTTRAEQALDGGAAGSSAAGEFPKFLTSRALPGAATTEVVVKFSGADDSPPAQRWRDLLVCEQLAAQTLGDNAARCRLLAVGGRHFLESERFDRIGRFGRHGVLSLECVNAGLVGDAGNDWPRVCQALAAQGLLPALDAERAAERQCFGRLIGNTDMHGGNLGFFVQADGLHLAPSYDQLPMRYAPQPGGDVTSPPLAPTLPLPAERERWLRMAPQALSFWQAAAADTRISDGFRTLCAGNAAALAHAMTLA